MNNTTIAIAGFVLLIGLGFGYIIGNGKPATGSHSMPDGSMMSQNIDQHFIAQMIPHHDGAIAMAKTALERSKRPEVIALSTAIISAQEKENADMKAWYQSWFGTAVPDMAGMGHMDSMSGDTQELASVSDAAFDREFLTQMIPHHEMALMMANMLKSGTERPEMKQLADNILTSQSSEIASMRGWLKSWYGEE